MKSQIELLQAQMPYAFEWREMLMGEIAEGTADYLIHIDRCRETLSPDEFERERQRAYDRHAARLEPVRRELDRCNGMVAAVLAALPPEPLVVAKQ